MARVIRIVSDLSGQENAQEVVFHADGKRYTIALTKLEAHNFKRTYDAALRRLDKYIEAATCDSISDRKPKYGAVSLTFQVRNWAKSEGYDVPARGRLPEWVWESWRAAGSPKSEDV